MKAYTKFKALMVAALLAFACQNQDDTLNTEIVKTGSLLSPVVDQHIEIDPENGANITFEWTEAQAADGGLVLYKILFDEPGGNFEDPVYTTISGNNGASTSFSLTQAYLNMIAEGAGINQLETGDIIWTVEASSGYQKKIFSESSTFSVTRPEGLATFPDYMYIYGSATEANSIENAVAFKEITNELPGDNFDLGIFESVTWMNSGEYYITNSVDPNTATHFYINDEGKIRTGNQPTSFTLSEGVYLVRMNLSQSTISFKKMSDMKLVIMANQAVKAELTYVGNHTFEDTDATFNFLGPGDPEAPSWLSWEEERYRYHYLLDGEVAYIGSYHNADMNASVVPGLTAYNVRPNGNQPEEYNNLYFLSPNASQWEGAWKFPDAFNGAQFTVRLVFDPMAEHYYQELELN